MTKFLLSAWILFSLTVHVSMAKPLKSDDDELDLPKRCFSSSSYYDQIAMSICASLSASPAVKRLIFPVRRKCPSNESCDQICKSRAVVDQIYSWATGSPDCIESLHLYKGRPQLAPNHSGNVDVNRVGLVTKRYYSCHVTGCGPNYCCCRKG